MRGGILLNKNAYIYKSKIIDAIFFFLLTLTVLYRWKIGLGGEKIIEFFFEGMQFLFLPIFICFIFYRANRYYNNIFCQIRYKDINEWNKSFLKDCVLASFILVTLYYLILFLCCFSMTLSYIRYILILYIHTLLIFVFIAQTNHQCIITKKASLSYFLCLSISVGYMIILKIMPPFYNFYVEGNENYFSIFMIMTLSIFIINVTIFMLKWKWEYLCKISMNFFIIIMAIILFLLQNIMYQNLSIIDSIGFPQIFFIVITEIVLPYFMWISSTVFLVFVTLNLMFKNYRSHLLFYAIRMRNRSKWLMKTFLKGSVVLCIMLVLKYGINELFRANNISFITYLVEGYFRIQILVLTMFLIYQFYKDTKLFSYGMIVFIVITFSSIVTGTGAEIILMRTHDILTIIWLGVVMLLLFIGNCYAVNHLDYY